MRLDQLANEIGAQVVIRPESDIPSIEHVYAGDRISDLLNHATDLTLLVSNLTGPQLIRLAQLMDVPGICLVNGATPETDLVDAAWEHETLLMVSPLGMFETCGRLYQCLQRQSKMLQ
jgi:hypothetical protein